MPTWPVNTMGAQAGYGRAMATGLQQRFQNQMLMREAGLQERQQGEAERAQRVSEEQWRREQMRLRQEADQTAHQAALQMNLDWATLDETARNNLRTQGHYAYQDATERIKNDLDAEVRALGIDAQTQIQAGKNEAEVIKNYNDNVRRVRESADKRAQAIGAANVAGWWAYEKQGLMGEQGLVKPYAEAGADIYKMGQAVPWLEERAKGMVPGTTIGFPGGQITTPKQAAAQRPSAMQQERQMLARSWLGRQDVRQWFRQNNVPPEKQMQYAYQYADLSLERQFYGQAGMQGPTPQNIQSRMTAADLYRNRYNQGKPDEQKITIDQALRYVDWYMQQMGGGGQPMRGELAPTPQPRGILGLGGPTPQAVQRGGKLSWPDYYRAAKAASPASTEADIGAGWQRPDAMQLLKRLQGG